MAYVASDLSLPRLPLNPHGAHDSVTQLISEYSYEPSTDGSPVSDYTWSAKVYEAWKAIMCPDDMHLVDAFPGVRETAREHTSYANLLFDLSWHRVAVPTRLFIQMLLNAPTDRDVRGLASTMMRTDSLRSAFLHPLPNEDVLDCLHAQTTYLNAMRIYAILIGKFGANKEDAVQLCDRLPHRQDLMIAWHLVYAAPTPLVGQFAPHRQCKPKCHIAKFDLLAMPQLAFVINKVNTAAPLKAVHELVKHLNTYYLYETTAAKVTAAIRGFQAPRQPLPLPAPAIPAHSAAVVPKPLTPMAAATAVTPIVGSPPA